jgi:hypothetical protein
MGTRSDKRETAKEERMETAYPLKEKKNLNI